MNIPCEFKPGDAKDFLLYLLIVLILSGIRHEMSTIAKSQILQIIASYLLNVGKETLNPMTCELSPLLQIIRRSWVESHHFYTGWASISWIGRAIFSSITTRPSGLHSFPLNINVSDSRTIWEQNYWSGKIWSFYQTWRFHTSAVLLQLLLCSDVIMHTPPNVGVLPFKGRVASQF